MTSPQLTRLNNHVAGLIGASKTPTILGLLPVETNVQEQILSETKRELNGRVERLLFFLNNFPASTAYAIALAIGKGVTEANFYRPLEQQLEMGFPMSCRTRVSVAFEEACKALGLVMPPAEEETHTDRNLRPVIFQAGILPYWVPHLTASVVTYLEKNPCPDLDDDSQVIRFARVLKEKVPLAQSRLRRTLDSTVGPLVSRAILRAFSTRDFDQLPPHWREPMREARQKTGGESIKSPYLRFSPESASMQVVLPKQSSKLVSFNSCWIIGSNTYNALIERALEASEFPEPTLQVRLTGLRNEFQDQAFTIKLQPDIIEPFFIFRSTDGKRLQLNGRREIDLAAGNYHVLLPIEHATSEDADFRTGDKFKTAEVEIFPERVPLEIFCVDQKFSVSPRVGSEVIIRDEHGKVIETVDRVPIFYGPDLSVVAFTPMPGDGDVSMQFRIECLDNHGVPAMTCSFDCGVKVGQSFSYDVSATLVSPFLKNLPAGIHEILVSAEGRLRSFRRKFDYWKGFQRTTKNFGFVCDKPPENLDPNTSIGIRQSSKGLEIAQEHLGPEVTIGVQHPSRMFVLAKPGIWLRIFDPEKLETRSVAVGSNIEVAGAEQLIIQSGDTVPWVLRCAHKDLALIKPGRSKQALSLGALLGQFGESATIYAENQLGRRVDLLSFAKANLARDLTIEHTPGSNSHRSTFRIGQNQLKMLRVRLWQFDLDNSSLADKEIGIKEGAFEIYSTTECCVHLNVSLDAFDWVLTVHVDLGKLDPGLFFIDFRSKKEGQTRWQALHVADKHGLSESRLAIRHDPVGGKSDSQLARLLNAASNDQCKGDCFESQFDFQISDEQLRRVISSLQDVLLFKYSSAVWPTVQWLETALVLACQHAYSTVDEERLRLFADLAVDSLARKSETSLSIQSALIFSSQETLLTQRGSTFCDAGPEQMFVAQVFRELGHVARAATLTEYAANNFHPPKGCAHAQFLNHFANAHSVFCRREAEFRNFDHCRFFNYLSTETQELDFKQAEIEKPLLLTPEHLLSAVRALNRRFRPLEQVRNANETGTTLGRLTSEIQAMGNQLDLVAPTLKSIAGVPNYAELSIAIRIAESSLVQTVCDLLLCINGLGRSVGYGLLSRELFMERINTLLSPRRNSVAQRTTRLSLLASLAPEMFSFFMLYWEATLKPLRRYEGN